MKIITKQFNIKPLNLSGMEWIERLEKGKYNVYQYTKEILLSPDFTSEQNIDENYTIITAKENSNIKDILEYAESKGYKQPHPETACLIREKFTDDELKAMGLWLIVVMHKAIKDSGGNPFLLTSSRDGGGREVGAYYGRPDFRLYLGYGFLFSVPQVSSCISDIKQTLNTSHLEIKKVSTTYEIEGNRVEIQDGKAFIKTKSGKNEFMFLGSTPETCEKMARVLNEAAKLARDPF